MSGIAIMKSVLWSSVTDRFGKMLFNVHVVVKAECVGSCCKGVHIIQALEQMLHRESRRGKILGNLGVKIDLKHYWITIYKSNQNIIFKHLERHIHTYFRVKVLLRIYQHITSLL